MLRLEADSCGREAETSCEEDEGQHQVLQSQRRLASLDYYISAYKCQIQYKLHIGALVSYVN
jgi:hypothetical protein